MPFAYYRRLSPARKRIYRRSDEITSIPLPRADELRPLASDLEGALEEEDRREAERICQRLADGLTERLKVPSTATVEGTATGRSCTASDAELPPLLPWTNSSCSV